MSNEDETFDCPNCGAEVLMGAVVCRECGASDDSGWNNDGEEEFATDEDFDYDDYIEREFGTPQPRTRSELTRQFVTAAILVLVCFAIALLTMFGG